MVILTHRAMQSKFKVYCVTAFGKIITAGKVTSCPQWQKRFVIIIKT